MADPTGLSGRRAHLSAAADARSLATRERLLDAFLSCLDEGDGEPSVSRIVQRAGVGRSTFYTHFATVEELALQAIDHALTALAPLDVRRRIAQEETRRAITSRGLRELRGRLARLTAIPGLLDGPTTRAGLRERLVSMMAPSLVEVVRAERPGATEDFVVRASAFIAAGTVDALLSSLARGPEDEEAWVEAMLELLPSWLTAERTAGD